MVVCGWPNAGAAVEDPNSPPEEGCGVEPNKEPPLEPNTGCVLPKLVAGLLNEPNVLDVPVPKPPPKKKCDSKSCIWLTFKGMFNEGQKLTIIITKLVLLLHIAIRQLNVY